MIRTACAYLALVAFLAPCPGTAQAMTPPRDDFGLYLDTEQGAIPLPLEKTSVRGTVRGFVARVDVTQVFVNPYDTAIEATYVFPLPERAAVHDMVMRVADREITAVIERREDAERTYEKAIAAGQTAALLTQERANLFTQKVGNIAPGQAIQVQLSYVEALSFEEGTSTFVFPTVVGPRYVPARVADAERITPPALSPDESAVHRIDLTLDVNPGRTIRALHSPSHALDVTDQGSDRALVKIAPADRYPNKDFILHIDVRGESPEVQTLTHRDNDSDGYVTLAVQPPAFLNDGTVSAKDLFFVVDNSGSMHGAPLAAAKQLVKTALRNLNPSDRFTIMRFSDSVSTLSSIPLENTSANIDAGVAYIDAMEGMGGTEMLSGVRRALEGEPEPGRVRIVFFLTDGYIGNDSEILNAVKTGNEANARLFSLGVGSSVNRYLLAGMARLGRGEMQVMRHDAEPTPFVERFYRRVRNPVLTDIEIDWGDLPVYDASPQIVPDLFSGEPLLLHGRYRSEAQGKVTVRGMLGHRPFEQQLTLRLPERAERPAIASLWARAKISEYSDVESGCGSCRKEDITTVALTHRLMSKYTAFVAVDREVVTRDPAAPLIAVEQRLPLPEGVSRRALGDLSRRQIPPGDPIISVAAPADANRVTAYFPFGLVKQLHFDRLREVWRGRFLVPAGIPDGDYAVLVVIELADGSIIRRQEPFTLDSATEEFIAFFVDSDGSMSPVSATTTEAKQMVELNVDTIEPATEVYVHCPSLGWNRMPLSNLDNDHILWDGLLVVSDAARVGKHSVLIVVRDAAGNRFERVLKLHVAPAGSIGESDPFIFTGEFQ